MLEASMPSDPAVLMTAPPSHLPVRPEWLASRQEEILEPELPIVDPHHHLVDRTNTGRYLLPELLADTGSGHNIIATVYLEWLSMYRADGPVAMLPVGEGEFANGGGAFAAGRGRLGALAGGPTLHVKLGGLGMRLFGFDVHTGELPPSSEQLATLWRPYIETCVEAFGPERAMFESNFPVDKGSGSYHVFWNAFKRIAQGCSAVEKTALFSGTASKFYRLD